jgi:hypothetical protein
MLADVRKVNAASRTLGGPPNQLPSNKTLPGTPPASHPPPTPPHTTQIEEQPPSPPPAEIADNKDSSDESSGDEADDGTCQNQGCTMQRSEFYYFCSGQCAQQYTWALLQMEFDERTAAQRENIRQAMASVEVYEGGPSIIFFPGNASPPPSPSTVTPPPTTRYLRSRTAHNHNDGQEHHATGDANTVSIPEGVLLAMEPHNCLNMQGVLAPWVLQQPDVRCHMTPYMRELLDMKAEDLDQGAAITCQ